MRWYQTFRACEKFAEHGGAGAFRPSRCRTNSRHIPDMSQVFRERFGATSASPDRPYIFLKAVIAILIAVISGVWPPSSARAQCLHSLEFIDLGLPPGDINNIAPVSVADVQCAVLTALWGIGGKIGPLPGCLVGPPARADVNCDGNVDIADVLIIINLALGTPLDPVLDANADGCPDKCAPPKVRTAFATTFNGQSTGSGYRVRPASITPALPGIASDGVYDLRARPLDRIPTGDPPQ